MNATPQKEPPPALPTGTVTFVFTDIEGSTARWERYPTEMERAVRVHDRLMRAVLTSYGGHAFKTVGDAFCVAFTRPADALAAALEAAPISGRRLRERRRIARARRHSYWSD